MSSIFSIFKKGLEKSAIKVMRGLSGMFGAVKAHDRNAFDNLEETLISADFGVAASLGIVAEIKDRYDRGKITTDADLRQCVSEAVVQILNRNRREINFARQGIPTIILMVGVNGSGKTTTIGKLASRWKAEGKNVMLAACDTFRAAATEQLKLWGEKAGVPVISSKHGADPASVAYDAVSAAIARHTDILLIDTAGRQQNQRELMDELAKIRRIIGKVCPDAPHEIWLTVDASLGANVLIQAREFSKAAAITGLILTKLDGTGRGGMCVALNKEFNLPTFFIGLGEQPEDLQTFDPVLYAEALFQK